MCILIKWYIYLFFDYLFCVLNKDLSFSSTYADKVSGYMFSFFKQK